MLDHVPNLISYVDSTLHYQYVNQTYSDWFGHRRDRMVGKHLADVVGPEAFARIRPYVERALGGETVEFDLLIPYKDAGLRNVNATYTPDIDAHGSVQGFIVCVSDVTQRRRAEAALVQAKEELEARVSERTAELQESQAKSKRYAELSLDLICTADFHGRMIEVNPAFTEILGWTREEMTTRPYVDFVHPDDAESTTQASTRLANGDTVMGFENRYRTRGGDYRIIEWNAVQDDARATIYAVGRDVTDRRRLEAEARSNAVARPLVRRLLLRDDGMAPEARRAMGASLARDAHADNIQTFLDVYAAAGGGTLTMVESDNVRFRFRGTELLETQRGHTRPTCHLALGFLEGVVRQLTGRDALGSELKCVSRGDAECVFVVKAR